VSIGVLLGAAGALLFTIADSDETVRGSGVAAEQVRSVGAFSAVELSGSNIVTIRVGGARSVVVRGDDNLLSHVTTTVRSGRLNIDTTGDVSSRTPMRVAVTVPALRQLALSGSGIVSAEAVDARSLTVTLSGSGVLRASGTARQLEVTLGGSGVAQLQDLVARDAKAAVSGSGRIDVTASRSLDATITGTGTIVYGGDPARVTPSITGTGAITRR
jgi:hypothetical protein